jgi:hypothetical protein
MARIQIDRDPGIGQLTVHVEPLRQWWRLLMCALIIPVLIYAEIVSVHEYVKLISGEYHTQPGYATGGAFPIFGFLFMTVWLIAWSALCILMCLGFVWILWGHTVFEVDQEYSQTRHSFLGCVSWNRRLPSSTIQRLWFERSRYAEYQGYNYMLRAKAAQNTRALLKHLNAAEAHDLCDALNEMMLPFESSVITN